MKNPSFGEMTFRHGWDAKTEILLWGRQFAIRVTAKAYRESDLPTEAQERAYAWFRENREIAQTASEKLVSDYVSPKLTSGETADSVVAPRTFLIERDGTVALLFDFAKEPDNGIAAILRPNCRVCSQDEYL